MKKLNTMIAISNLIFLFACTDNKNGQFKENDIATNIETIDLKGDYNVEKDTISFIDIQPYEGLNVEIVKYIYTEMKEVYPKVNLLKKQVIPIRAFYEPRKRYKADTIISIQRDAALLNHIIVGLTHYDISTESGAYKDWGIMGLGYQPGNACVASTFRLNKKKDVKQQYFKVVIHEVGHTQGLPHCADATCIMTDAKGKNTTETEKGFCKKCKFVLESKGFNLKNY